MIGMLQIFTISDAGHVVGLVGLVSSLRMHGVDDRVTVLDVGLGPGDRDHLDPACDWVELRQAEGRHPWLLAPYGAWLDPHGVVAYLDCDLVVTAPLDPIVEAAAEGAVCVGIDPWSDRWFAEWTDLFGLRAPLRREEYVNSGAVVFSTEHHPDLLARWWELCQRLDPAEVGRWRPIDHAAGLADQDALNALLMSEVPASAVVRMPAIVHNPDHFGVEVVDVRRMACRVGPDRTPTVILHGIGVPKPWAPRAWRAIRRTAYVRCLEVALARSVRPDRSVPPTPGGGGVPRFERGDLPWWLRPGPGYGVARAFGVVWSWLARTTRPWRRRVRSR